MATEHYLTTRDGTEVSWHELKKLGPYLNAAEVEKLRELRAVDELIDSILKSDVWDKTSLEEIAEETGFDKNRIRARVSRYSLTDRRIGWKVLFKVAEYLNKLAVAGKMKRIRMPAPLHEKAIDYGYEGWTPSEKRAVEERLSPH